MPTLEDQDSRGHRQLSRIVSARKQLISGGISYTIRVLVGFTNCTAGSSDVMMATPTLLTSTAAATSLHDDTQHKEQNMTAPTGALDSDNSGGVKILTDGKNEDFEDEGKGGLACATPPPSIRCTLVMHDQPWIPASKLVEGFCKPLQENPTKTAAFSN